ncbi:putative ATP binding protein [Tripterygium wilfordii]|uniref:Putative ATP binding protein n=1 Tax=Tripterygium wilfordii TaxID=458696 RepID=A0A7J7CL93_TRIWF|nr:putative ATP binding protein [Tripterygium wilfordii]
MDLQSKTQINKRDNKDELEMQMEQLALDYEILKQENHDLAYKLEQSELQEQLKFQYECSSSFANDYLPPRSWCQAITMSLSRQLNKNIQDV